MGCLRVVYRFLISVETIYSAFEEKKRIGVRVNAEYSETQIRLIRKEEKTEEHIQESSPVPAKMGRMGRRCFSTENVDAPGFSNRRRLEFLAQAV